MNSLGLDVLYEDNHLLVVNKPAGIPTQGAPAGESSVLQRAKEYIKSRYDKPGNVYLGIVSRLDSGTTGVVVLARTSKAAARLTRQFSAGEVAKTYWAIVEHEPRPNAATIADWLHHDDNRRRVVVVPEGTEGAKRAELTYRTIQKISLGWLVEIQPATGRKHQIRVQLAARELPILGDQKYGSRRPWPAGMALHARTLQLKHPVGGQSLTFTAPVPRTWGTSGTGERPV